MGKKRRSFSKEFKLDAVKLGSIGLVTTSWWTGLRALNDEFAGEDSVIRIAVGR